MKARIGFRDLAYKSGETSYFDGRHVTEVKIIKHKNNPDISYWVWALSRKEDDRTPKTFVALVENNTATTQDYGIFNMKFHDAVYKCERRIAEICDGHDQGQLCFTLEEFSDESITAVI